MGIPIPGKDCLNIETGSCFNVNTIFPGMRIPIIKIRQFWDWLIFNNGNPYASKTASLYWDGPLMSIAIELYIDIERLVHLGRCLPWEWMWTIFTLRLLMDDVSTLVNPYHAKCMVGVPQCADLWCMKGCFMLKCVYKEMVVLNYELMDVRAAICTFVR